MHARTRQRLPEPAANDNRAPALRTLSALGESALERLLGLAGALRFGLLLAGI